MTLSVSVAPAAFSRRDRVGEHWLIAEGDD
jgi:hypothetical protein